jgi:hypothetical protein
VRAALGEGGVDAADQARRVGGQVEERTVPPHPPEQPLLAERDRLHLRRTRQGGEDNLSLLGHRARRLGPRRAIGQKGLGRRAPDVMHHQRVPGPPEVGGHAGAHGAEADEADPHGAHTSSANTSRATFAAVIAAGQPA